MVVLLVLSIVTKAVVLALRKGPLRDRTTTTALRSTLKRMRSCTVTTVTDETARERSS